MVPRHVLAARCKPTKVLNVMREHDNICSYLDIPLQHVNERIFARDESFGLSSAIRSSSIMCATLFPM